MADQRSVMKEYRLLEQKRQSGPLSPHEEARFAQLRELVGPEMGVGASKPGFDVNAAAARLRESLLPAGLRNRPSPAAEVAPPEPPPEPEAAPATGLAAVWDAAPFAPLTEPAQGLAEDALFDPGTLGADVPAAEGAWDPNAQPYDAGAQAWDPNAQPYDPNAPAYDPNAAVYDPNAQPYDAGAQAWDPNAQPYDPNAPAYDPNAAVYDPNAQPYDAGAQAWDPDAQPYDPNAAAQWDAATQPAWDPSLAAPWGGEVPAEPSAAAEPLEAAAPVEANEPAWDAGVELGQSEPAATAEASLEWSEGADALGSEPTFAPADTSWDANASPQQETAAAEQAWDAGVAEPELVAESEPLAPPEPSLEAAWDAGLATEAEPSLDLGAESPGEPAPEPSAEELLPFDAGAASAIAPEAIPEGWGAEPLAPSEELPMEELAAELPAEPASHGDFSGDLSPEQHTQVDALPSEEAQGLLAPLGAGQELTSDDDAFSQGFHLESNGSFGQTTGAAAPEPTWGEAPSASGAEGEAWESAAAFDLGGMDAGALPPMGLEPPGELEEIDVEEIPIVEGTELLEEIPPEPTAIAPPPPSAAEVRIEGVHRVVVHTLEGLVKRGVISDATLDAGTLALAPQPDAAPEELPTAKVKAIFFMLAPGDTAPAPEGKRVRVTFNDGRQLAGFSPDYTDAGAGFFMIPADTRTHTGRIWVYRSAVKNVSVS
jgi:hypothetical protein